MVKITPSIKSHIITRYLQNNSFGKISKEVGISKTAAYTVVKEWNSKVMANDLDEIRHFLKEVIGSGITVSECVKGYRTYRMLKAFEIKDDSEEWIDTEESEDRKDEENDILDRNFSGKTNKENSIIDPENESHSKFDEDNIIKENYSISEFVDEIYRKCTSRGIKPSIIVWWIQDLLDVYSFTDDDYYKTVDSLRDDNIQVGEEKTKNINKSIESISKSSNFIPYTSRISFFIQEKKNHVKHLEKTKKSLLDDLGRLTLMINEITNELDQVLKKRKEIYSYFKWYESLRRELFVKQKLVLRHNIDNLVNVINEFKIFDYDVTKIIKEYEDTDSLVTKKKNLESEINYKLNIKRNIEIQNANLEESAGYHSQTINIYSELHKHGIGLKELKFLANLIYECANSNDIEIKSSIKKFFKDIENQYDNKLGFEKTIEDLKKEKKKLEEEVPEYKSYLRLQGIVSPLLVQLQRNGVTNEDIIGMNNLVLEFRDSDFLANPFQGTLIATNNKKRTWDLFIDKLKTLRNINLEINNRISKIDQLNNQTIEIGWKKDRLESAYQITANNYNFLIYKFYETLEMIKKLNDITSPKLIIFLFFSGFDQSGFKDSKL